MQLWLVCSTASLPGTPITPQAAAAHLGSPGFVDPALPFVGVWYGIDGSLIPIRLSRMCCFTVSQRWSLTVVYHHGTDDT